MKRLHLQLTLLSGALALSSLAIAETGIGYDINTKGDPQVMSDGKILQETSADSIWFLEDRPEGFPAVVKARCTAVYLMGVDYSNKGSSFRCITTDSDGDGYLVVGHVAGLDWSGCTNKVVSGWGKFAGFTASGTCQSGGPFAGADTSVYTWTSQWTLRE